MTAYQLPCRPYGVIDAINRAALATGSCRNAERGSHADYNGHYVTVEFNSFLGYWVAEYTWAGRVVLHRGEFRACLDAAKREHDRGALGSQVMALPLSAQDEAVCLELGFEPAMEARPMACCAQKPAWFTALHAEAHQALSLERQVGIPATGLLAQAALAGEGLAGYKARIDAYVAANRRRA